MLATTAFAAWLYVGIDDFIKWNKVDLQIGKKRSKII